MQGKIDFCINDSCPFCSSAGAVSGTARGLSFVSCIDKLIVNFSNHFDSLFIQNPFLITDFRSLPKEVTQHLKWINPGNLQMELVDFQADMAMKEKCVRTDPSTFWLQMVP